MLLKKKIRSLKTSDLAQLPHFTGGELRPRERQVMKVPTEFMAGLG